MTKPRFPILARCFPVLRLLLALVCLLARPQASIAIPTLVTHLAGQTSIPRGVTTTNTYNDHDSLLTDVAYSDSTPAVHYSNFDAYGRCQTMTDGTGTQTFTYDDDDDLTGKNVTYTGLPMESLSYTYYNDGSRHTMGTPAGTFTYAYDGAGRITGITDPYSTASSWTYYNNDWLATQHLGTAVTNGYTYNAAGQLTAQTNTATVAGSTFNIGSYHYDGVGNLLGYTATGSGATAAGTYSYGYDSKDEVTSDQFVPSGGGTAFSRSYAYDGAGNPTTFRGQGLTFNSDNQPTGTSLTFDGDGNTTYDGGSAATWNGADELTSWGSLTGAKYDGMGHRAVRSRYTGYTYTLYDGDTPVCALDSSGNVTSTVTMGPTGLANLHLTSGGAAEFINDPRGNTVQTVNASGTVSNIPAMDAYGEYATNTAGVFDYQDTYPTGQFGSGPNALALAFRDYDTSTGRLLSRDPLGYGGGINLYGYTKNNPVNGNDPSGLDPYDWVFDDSPAADKYFTSDLTARDPCMMQAGFDAASNLLHQVPGLGVGLDASDAITGHDFLAERELSPFQRLFGAAMVGVAALGIFGGGDATYVDITHWGKYEDISRMRRAGRIDPAVFVIIGKPSKLNFWRTGVSFRYDYLNHITMTVPSSSLHMPNFPEWINGLLFGHRIYDPNR